MKKVSCIRIFLMVLVAGCVTSCASLYFDYDPAWMTESQSRNVNDVALISGQAYNKQIGQWIQILPQKIDDKRVYLLGRAVSMVYVSPGKHRLELFVSFGNALHSATTKDSVVLDVDVRAGQAYQILYERRNMEGRDRGVRFALVNIGAISHVNEYIAKNASYKKGEPLPKMGSIAQHSMIDKSVNNADHLNVKSPAVPVAPESKPVSPASPSRTTEPVVAPVQGGKGVDFEKGHPWSPVEFEM